MHVHILGICGTFMGSLALLARDLGHKVTGSDANIYPPMSTQLERAGIIIQEGYDASHLMPAPDLVIVGNAMSRGVDAVEYMLNQGIVYTSGPQFLAEHVLQYRHVLAVAGTHGKTTTTTMLAWVLQYCGVDTGFLIGGVPLVDTEDTHLKKAFAHSSYLGASIDIRESKAEKRGYFVIEADEYDSAFFDKRSKFVHYRPRTAILNNLEFDHADIFKDLDAIQTQFHHMIRMIPSNGQIIMPAHTPSLEVTIAKGCWTPIWRTQINEAIQEGGSKGVSNTNKDAIAPMPTIDWEASLLRDDGSQFTVTLNTVTGKKTGQVNWNMSGQHNVNNAMVAVAAAYDIGIDITKACDALSAFAGIKRRMELIAEMPVLTQAQLNAQSMDTDVPIQESKIYIYDDFAHHPTAIITTLDGAKKKLPTAKVWAIIEPRSNTMKLGVHKDSLAQSAQLADEVIWYEPVGLEWGLSDVIDNSVVSNQQQVITKTQAIIDYLVTHIGKSGRDEAIIIMSNGGFETIHQRLIQALQQR